VKRRGVDRGEDFARDLERGQLDRDLHRLAELARERLGVRGVLLELLRTEHGRLDADELAQQVPRRAQPVAARPARHRVLDERVDRSGGHLVAHRTRRTCATGELRDRRRASRAASPGDLAAPGHQQLVDVADEARQVEPAEVRADSLAHEHRHEPQRHVDGEIEILVDGVAVRPRDREHVFELVADEVDVGEPDDAGLALERVDLAMDDRRRALVEVLEHAVPRRFDPLEPLDRGRAELLDELVGKDHVASMADPVDPVG
jgi:hypothetical protein